ncbi:hypothetical protein Halhy_0268 [Haliscomenobacter hydrossis DSM 1100]|uniref:Uncharacterized protein n=1 Tax=Haliscomenobacter hydrossis (strain ATCC 27775 / DSM 1100 / LMG 10767 / O) TaxID=760192 RepID=F4KV04_HALH1|nr:hypothetical protein Halhy_0268 [Haliscomenobacter hydrossis DSM 1100]
MFGEHKSHTPHPFTTYPATNKPQSLCITFQIHSPVQLGQFLNPPTVFYGDQYLTPDSWASVSINQEEVSFRRVSHFRGPLQHRYDYFRFWLHTPTIKAQQILTKRIKNKRRATKSQ